MIKTVKKYNSFEALKSEEAPSSSNATRIRKHKAFKKVIKSLQPLTTHSKQKK